MNCEKSLKKKIKANNNNKIESFSIIQLIMNAIRFGSIMNVYLMNFYPKINPRTPNHEQNY